MKKLHKKQMNDKHKNQDLAALSGAKYDSGIGGYNLLLMF